MEILKVTKRNGAKGLCIYCTTCKTKVKEKGKCGATGKRINSCDNKDNHKYKIVVQVPGSERKEKTKVLSAKTENEAIKQAICFREELEKSNYATKMGTIKESVPKTLAEGMAFYISYLNNETPHSKSISKEPKHIEVKVN